MFVRKKKNRSGSISIQIVQKINRHNKVLKSIGSSSDPNEIENLYLQALYEMPRLYGATLFDTVKEPKISDLNNDSIRVIGPDIAFGFIYDKIGFNQFKEPLLKHLVISRITHPGSKLRLSNYLKDTGKEDISVYSIYRFLDKLNNKLKHKIEELSFSYTKNLLGGNIGVVFYDMTTIYFEASEPDDFRITGFSKDGKHQNPQIMLGLLVGKDGYPIGYEIFEGNSFEGHTLIPVLKKYSSRFNLGKPIIIADSGLLTNSNIEQLTKHGYQFILGARIKNESNAIIEKIMDLKLHDGEVACLNKSDKLKLHIGYSESRAKKDRFNRDRGIKKLEKNLLSGRLTKSNINNRGYNKFLKMEGEISISIDNEKIKGDENWDGLKGYLTNTELTGSEVVDNYNNLWKIEKAFRISKTDLKIRPIYHRLKERIEAHICISFMAYLVYKELERGLKEKNSQISMDTAIEQINKMYEVVVNDTTLNSKVIRLKNNKIQEEVLNVIHNTS
jgi:transposase